MDDPLADQIADPEAYAGAHTSFLQGFLGPSFASVVPSLEPVWAATRERIAADPAGAAPSYRLVAGLLRRAS